MTAPHAMLDLAGLPIAANLVIFVVASVAIAMAGSRVVRHVDAIADKNAIGQAFAVPLLGGITSPPKMAAVSGASWIGNAQLSLSGPFGQPVHEYRAPWPRRRGAEPGRNHFGRARYGDSAPREAWRSP
jgi:hypothetical protein